MLLQEMHNDLSGYFILPEGADVKVLPETKNIVEDHKNLLIFLLWSSIILVMTSESHTERRFNSA
jgi:hypothetical protein